MNVGKNKTNYCEELHDEKIVLFDTRASSQAFI